MAFQKFPEPQDPAADLDYTVTITNWFGADPVDPTTVEVEAVNCELHTISATATTVVFWVREGVVDEEALITITASSVGGRTDQRTLVLKIEER